MGATAAFPYDRMTVERFRAAFPGARWREDLRAWFVPGTTAERRLNRWLGRELSGVLAYADQRGRDAFAFEPIHSRYLEAADDLLIRTPYSRTVVAEMRAVPWASSDPTLRAWRAPYRSWEELRRRWPAIEAAAARHEPAERRRRQDEGRGSPQQQHAAARAVERRRHRYPVPDQALPPLERVVMTHQGALVITAITGELVEAAIAERFYPELAASGATLVWAAWRRPSHDELVKAWPSRRPSSAEERARGWWQPRLDELRVERRLAAGRERKAKGVAPGPH